MNKYYYRFFGSSHPNYKPEMYYCTGKSLDQRNSHDYFCTGSKVYKAEDDWYAGLSIVEIKNAIIMLGFKWTDKIKDGEEQIVYEGDLIKNIGDDACGVVKFGCYNQDGIMGNHLGFYVDWSDTNLKNMYRKDLGYWLNESKIVGNIHENPELIEIKK